MQGIVNVTHTHTYPLYNRSSVLCHMKSTVCTTIAFMVVFITTITIIHPVYNSNIKIRAFLILIGIDSFPIGGKTEELCIGFSRNYV